MADRRIIRRHFRHILIPRRQLQDRENPLEIYSQEECYRKFRFYPETIIFICQLVNNTNTRATLRSGALTVIQSVCMCLRFLACGTFYMCIGDMSKASKSTICREVNIIVPALAQLAGRFIRFPSGRGLVAVKNGFQDKAGFPNVVGCIDGTLVKLEAPHQNEEDFVCRKGFHAINVQICCDNTRLITNIVAKWPGSVHDSRIFTESRLCGEFETGTHRGFLLGDSGYGIRRYLLTPYRDPQTEEERAYNAAHRTTRTLVEQTIGILKRKFAVIKYVLRVQPAKACNIIAACAVLYNIGKFNRIMEDNDEDDDEDNDEDGDNSEDDNGSQHVSGVEGAKRRAGQAIRQHVAANIFANSNK
ncbi:hypothetical protein SNE40_004592 [Patella caerulea]|uniref:Putative nuclease HARBI1 n=1 Tax=Patella caerulea TaxID=87958 RepID=A0AAN8K9U6_PATCE